MNDYELEEEILELITDFFGRDCSWSTVYEKLNNEIVLKNLYNNLDCNKEQFDKCIKNILKLSKENIIVDKKMNIDEDFK